MLLAAVLFQASLAASTFAPPTDAPLRIVTDRTETSADKRHYRLQRLVRFSREATGYRAEVLVLGSTSDAPQALGNLVERGLATLEGGRIVFHLDAKAQIVAIDDMAALWERVCRGVADAAAAQPEGTGLAAKLAATLRALPPERQRALLATLVTAIVSTEPLDSVGTVTSVKLPGTSPFGAPVTLDGTRRTVAAENGLLRTTTIASATVALLAQGDAPGTSGTVSLERVRTFDPRTGLITSGLDTTRHVTRSGPAGRETLLVTRLSVERAGPSDWPN
ncbi:hypothetical protein E5A73_07540 [Sphingomonas gei]|uniref:Uncharacterized protein n=1 Tax=Sphingomonas gei TaxID=1395960 RepID=A0A4S1XE03_9SPHN|nr:hypothetical protein [Sphingomonas gei]TGX53977.1 hypothetical protein E5A73_07540 [Sphingomonas gei]